MLIRDKVIFEMSAEKKPVLKIKSGDTITFLTRDCYNNQLLEEETDETAVNWDTVNPATGPVYVEEAFPGDVLKITVQDIKLGKTGVMCAVPEEGVLGKHVKERKIRRIPVVENIAEFTSEIKITCNPMIGVIGVAPGKDAVSCGEPGSHGGNMDNARIGKGAVLYLPVFHNGALLSIGDVHACMGDGEIMVTGLEIPAEVTITAEVVKSISIENPVLEDASCWYTIASNTDLDDAIYSCVLSMTEAVMRKKNLCLEDAGMLLSAAGNLRFCQVVDPKKTVCMEIKKNILPEFF